MEEILYQYSLNLTTWVYLSSLLTIAIYFKFSRLWSVRNLDLLGLISFAPGLLLADYGASRHDSGLEQWGYSWLFAAGGFFLVRLLFDPTMIRRPLLEPNMSPGGLTFIGVSLVVFLMANVLTKAVDPADLAAASQAEGASPAQGALAKHGPGYPLLFWIPAISTKPLSNPPQETPQVASQAAAQSHTAQAATARAVAILSHLAVVMGMVLIGKFHFDNIRTGIATAVLYLLLPYTAQSTGRVDHVMPAALLIWAVLSYRNPVTSGILLGLATGAVYYPLFLAPLWIGFYWQRGLGRFGVGFAVTLALLVGSLAFTSSDVDVFFSQVKQMFGWTSLSRARVEGGFWAFSESGYPYRISVFVATLAMSAVFALWPMRKNLGTLLSCSAAVMLGTQFWHAQGGGVHMAWYLPLLLLTIFRPNLDDRVALATLRVGWFNGRKLNLRNWAA